MTFTDDDLKRLKEIHSQFDEVDRGFAKIEGVDKYFPSKPILALIARLEAAERCAEALNRSRGQWIHSVNAEENLASLDAWRKAAGK